MTYAHVRAVLQHPHPAIADRARRRVLSVARHVVRGESVASAAATVWSDTSRSCKPHWTRKRGSETHWCKWLSRQTLWSGLLLESVGEIAEAIGCESEQVPAWLLPPSCLRAAQSSGRSCSAADEARS